MAIFYHKKAIKINGLVFVQPLSSKAVPQLELRDVFHGKRVGLRQRYRGCLTGFYVPLLPKPQEYEWLNALSHAGLMRNART
jgi:hypothetical protein